jgi:hypothetical protein
MNIHIHLLEVVWQNYTLNVYSYKDKCLVHVYTCTFVHYVIITVSEQSLIGDHFMHHSVL